MDIYLPIAEVSVNAPLLVALGALVGFISGLLGVGGGFQMTPVLVFLGIPPAVAVASMSNHVAASSIVFDCTGSTKKKRAEFIQFAKDHGLPVRILWVTTSMETSMEQNKERAYRGGPYVPPVAFYVYRKNLEPPTEEEGTVLVLS